MSELPPLPADAASPDAQLRQGQAALKQRQYTVAIHRFSVLAQNLSASNALRLKARIGLVKALMGAGETDRAITIATKLAQHPHPNVQQWAQATLETLATQRSLESPEPPADEQLSGFRPLAPGAALPPPMPPPPLAVSLGKTSAEASEPALGNDLAFREEVLSPPVSSSPVGAGLPNAVQSAPPASLDREAPTSDRAPSLPPPQANLPAVANSPGPTSEATPVVPPEPLSFQPAGRLPRPRALPTPAWEPLLLWIVQAITAIGLLWIGPPLLQGSLSLLRWPISPILRRLPFSLNWLFFPSPFFLPLLLIGLFLASPWLLDWLFRRIHASRPLAISTLKQDHPEGCRLLRRVCQERGWQIPQLHLIPTNPPVLLSYGWLPRWGRIVISQGVLNCLDEEEFAALLGYEMAHFTGWTAPFMSLVAVLLQGTYQIYWQAGQWGDRQRARWRKGLGAAVSAIGYGLYWGMRKIFVWPARLRVFACDRQAAAWTGNPNALTRALVKLHVATAATIQQHHHTPALLESTDLLTAWSYEAAIAIGPLYPDPAFLTALRWDVENPYRRWLALNSSHPPLGERLKRLNRIAAQWQLPSSLPFPLSSTAPQTFQHRLLAFLQQISPYLGPIAGIGAAMLLWFISGILAPLGMTRIGWIAGDTSVLRGILLLGTGIGIMLRLNRYFPDITPRDRQDNPAIAPLLANPSALPTDSQAVRLDGILLGRRGITNWFCQDLILQTPTGLCKLHFLSMLGAFGNYLLHPHHPSDWVGKSITVQGWFRKGATPWIDVEQWLQSGKPILRANAPLWSTLLSLTLCACGLWILVRG